MDVSHSLHTAILVSDLSASQYFYGEVLALETAERPLSFPGEWYQIGTYQIHLILDITTPYRLHNMTKWSRNHHLALAIADLTQAKEHLTKLEWDFQESASGRSAIFVHDPDGNVIELTQLS